MAGMGELGRMMAAKNMMGAGAGAPPPESEVPEDVVTEGPAPSEDVEQAISMIEGALAQAAPDVAERAREHLEALREIAAELGAVSGGEEAQAPVEPSEEVPQEELPPGAM